MLRPLLVLIITASLVSCAPMPPKPITVDSNYNAESLDAAVVEQFRKAEEEFCKWHTPDPTLSSPPPCAELPASPPVTRVKVFITSEPRNLISEEIIRQQVIRSELMTAVERQIADVVIVIRAYNVEISDGASTTESIMLEQHQVSNIMGRTFFMPDASSWSVDIMHRGITGVYELAYTIQSNSGQELAQRVHRDRIERETTTCSQPKIINVFGGVSPANFWANDALKSKCTGGGPVSSKSAVQQQIEEVIGHLVRKAVLDIHNPDTQKIKKE